MMTTPLPSVGALLPTRVYGPGNVWFVNSNGGSVNNTGADWENALASINDAIAKCDADAGDIIVVAPNHSEDVATDGAITLDVAGVTIFGIRRGREMPTINATAIAGSLKVTAARCTIANLRFTGNADATTGILQIAAADCAVLNCEYRDVTGQATDVLMLNTDADRCLIDGWRHIGDSAAGTNASVAIVGTDAVEIRNSYFYGNFAVGAIDFRTTLSTQVNIHDCTFWTENAADIAIVDTVTGSTGTIGPNLYIRLEEDEANITEAITGATFHFFDPIWVVNANNERGLQIDKAISADA